MFPFIFAGAAALAVRALVEALVEDDEQLDETGSEESHPSRVVRPHATRRCGGTSLKVFWADVMFDDQSDGKVRPVVVLDELVDGYRVLRMTSRDRTGIRGFVSVSPESSFSYDKEAAPSWVDCRSTVNIRFEDLRFPNRTGELSIDESDQVWLTVIECGVEVA